jgi:hypothetical protein
MLEAETRAGRIPYGPAQSRRRFGRMLDLFEGVVRALGSR